MHIAALDLMPLLWLACVLLSAVLAFYGEKNAPACTLPSAAVALCLYFYGHPPRLQVAVFFAFYFSFRAGFFLVSRYMRAKKAKKFAILQKTLDSENSK